MLGSGRCEGHGKGSQVTVYRYKVSHGGVTDERKAAAARGSKGSMNRTTKSRNSDNNADTTAEHFSQQHLRPTSWILDNTGLYYRTTSLRIDVDSVGAIVPTAR